MKDGEPPREIRERTFSLLWTSFVYAVVATQNLVASNLAQQLLKSGASLGANVQEAQAGRSGADFISTYSLALKETRETLYWLRSLDASGELSNGACKILLR